MIGRDTIVGLVCLAGSLALLAMSRGLPKPALVPIGPGFYPRILLAVTAFLSVLLLLNGLRRGEGKAGPSVSYRLVLTTFAVFIAYVVLLPLLGYRLATFLFVGSLQVVLEPSASRRWMLMAVVALVTSLVTYYLFEVYLSVLLPRGRLTGF